MLNEILSSKIYQLHDKSPTCIDLFCGAGGLSVGFAIAGGIPVGAVDMDKDAIDTYKRIFPMAADHVECCRIETWEPRLEKGNVDVIIGGPPCQGFSLARGQRFVDDPRNGLYKYFVKTVDRYQPKWFVMENVEGIINIGKGVILEQILEDFTQIGYKVEYKVVNMAEYGVPQLRKRAIFVGNRINVDFEWPRKSHYDKRKFESFIDDVGTELKPFNSVNSVLSDLLLPQGNFFSHRANAQMKGPRNRCAYTEPAYTLRVRGDEFALCEEPATSAFIPDYVPAEEIVFTEPKNLLQKFLQDSAPLWITRMPKNRTTEVDPPKLKGTRRLTLREQARLQTFPDWVDFVGRKTSQAKQIGNAVPPLFAAQLFKKIFEYL